jgi:hypothetical protein
VAAAVHAQDCTDVVQSHRNMVVFIHAIITQKVTGAMSDQYGTGFLVSPSGYVLTNYHVVAGKSDDEPNVPISGSIASINASSTPMLVIAKDVDQDLALLQLENSAIPYEAVARGNPSNTNVGDPLCSLGFPLNQEFTFTAGFLNGKVGPHGWWLTQMPENPGESGAPVFDLHGKVVAIKVGGFEKAQDLNLMIPFNLAGVLMRYVDEQQSNSKRVSNTVKAEQTIYTVLNGFRYPAQSAFLFATGSIVAWGTYADVGVANPGGDNELAQLFLNNNSPPYADPKAAPASAGIIDMHTSNLDSVSEAPADDSAYSIHYFLPEVGAVYCVRTADGHHFAKMKIIAVTNDRISFEYVYQPSGSRSF